MPSNKQGLFVTDLDGTLLRSDATVSEYSLRVINRLIAGGVHFTVATSRSPDKALSLLRGLQLRLPVICLNGALTVDPVSSSLLDVHAIDSGVVGQLLLCSEVLGVRPFLLGVEHGRDILMHMSPENPAQEAFLAQRSGEERLRRVGTLQPLQQTLSMTFVDGLEQLRPLSERLAREFGSELETRLMADLYIAGGGTLELSRGGVDKDLSMFVFAGTSVAVANAQPEVLAAAKLRCGANDADGVARFLEEHLVAAD
jgi:5-amino-6-(5-phospho-D-ribitylamino)uracil phosphatase